MKPVIIDGETLSIEDVVEVARNYARVKLSERAKLKITKARKLIDKVVKEGKAAYGIKTGFGELCTIAIPQKDVLQLQKNLIMSHASGVGNLLPENVVRAIILIRANTLAKGCSGVRLELVEMLIELLNKKLVPCIYEKGSVGASGDLAPLAHLALTIIGEGDCLFNGRKISAREALQRAGLKKLELQAKEGLALINGTSVMTAIAVLAVYDAENILKHSQVASAISLEALKGTDRAFDDRIMRARPHRGQIEIANNLRKLLAKSEVIISHRECERVQDPYTIRCIPQVLGASKDVLDWVRKITETEINSATDNPLVFGNELLPSGNFHGEHIAIAMDSLSIALAEIGSFAERRIARLLDTKLSGLPPFLTDKSGLNSGLMALQYTAAALASENKCLAHPASVDSIPTSANQEDHVSMGTISARKALEILRNVEYIVAIEFLCAAQGLEFNRPLKAGIGVEEAYKVIRKNVKKLGNDRVMHKDIEKIVSLIEEREILKAVERAVGKLE
ncbi:MAG: histidine ammonia-lyase [Candidatus Thermoplasmatota archaeon]|nr:histidine ammonia-lyase [Candidatus Thermoplasmatota archaeon]